MKRAVLAALAALCWPSLSIACTETWTNAQTGWTIQFENALTILLDKGEGPERLRTAGIGTGITERVAFPEDKITAPVLAPTYIFDWRQGQHLTFDGKPYRLECR